MSLTKASHHSLTRRHGRMGPIQSSFIAASGKIWARGGSHYGPASLPCAAPQHHDHYRQAKAAAPYRSHESTEELATDSHSFVPQECKKRHHVREEKIGAISYDRTDLTRVIRSSNSIIATSPRHRAHDAQHHTVHVGPGLVPVKLSRHPI